jgi:hypothetical protein
MLLKYFSKFPAHTIYIYDFQLFRWQIKIETAPYFKHIQVISITIQQALYLKTNRFLRTNSSPRHALSVRFKDFRSNLCARC